MTDQPRGHDAVDPIRQHLVAWEIPHVHIEVFRTADPAEIARQIDAFCRRHLGSSLRATLFHTASQGVTHGLELQDGRRAVLKLHQRPDVNPDRPAGVEVLRSVDHALRALHANGFPCPQPILGPTLFANGIATVQSYLVRGEHGDGFRASHRRALAESLVEIIRQLTPLKDELPGISAFLPAPGRLYPTPHSKLFDFEATAAGAEWIDEIAVRAKLASLDPPPDVVGHGDWRIQHVRFEGDRVSASYDWDSLSWLPETHLVGHTAAAYTTDWSTHTPARIPTPEAIPLFLADYEVARGRAFTREERQVVDGACAYAIAYGARCQHALTPDRDAGNWPEDSWPGLLRDASPMLLRGVRTVRASS